MATEKTRADLVVRALDKLGATASGQNPSAEDYDLVDAQVDSVLDSLASQEIYSADPDAIALDAYQALAVHLAYAVAEDFGKPEGSMDKAVAEATGVLKRITAARPTGETMVVDYM